MDILTIEHLKIHTTIGTLNWERQIKQILYFDVQWSVDVAKAAEFDNIDEAVDYVRVSEALQNFVEASAFLLIETLAERTAAFLLAQFNFAWIRIKLTKPGVINHAQGVSITIERGSMATHGRLNNGNGNL